MDDNPDQPATMATQLNTSTVNVVPAKEHPSEQDQQNSTSSNTAAAASAASSSTMTSISSEQRDVLNRLDLAPSTLEALKTLSTIGANEGDETFSSCHKLTASLEQIRAKKNMKLFEKLDKIKQDFSGLNHKIAQMEESISDLREVTSNLVNSLPVKQ